MSFRRALFFCLERANGLWWSRAAPDRIDVFKADTTAQAVGDCLALLASIFEREAVISASEFAKLLNEFAVVTAATRPQRGQLLISWAARLEETAAALGEPATPR